MVVSVLMLSLAVLVCVSGLSCAKAPVPAGDRAPQIDSAIGVLLVRYNADRKVSRREFKSAEGSFSRIERRVTVPTDFNTLSFNHELSQSLAPYGAAVVASEKSDANTVSMHIKKDGIITQSVILILKNESDKK